MSPMGADLGPPVVALGACRGSDCCRSFCLGGAGASFALAVLLSCSTVTTLRGFFPAGVDPSTKMAPPALARESWRVFNSPHHRSSTSLSESGARTAPWTATMRAWRRPESAISFNSNATPCWLGCAITSRFLSAQIVDIPSFTSYPSSLRPCRIAALLALVARARTQASRICRSVEMCSSARSGRRRSISSWASRIF